MIAALAVLGLVIDRGTDYFYFADTEITLEVGHVVHCIPQTELDIREKFQLFFLIGIVCKGKTVDLTRSIHRNECEQVSLYTVFGRTEAAVADAVAALIGIQLGLGWFPARIPDGIAIFDIVIFSISVVRDIVVAVTCDTKQLCIFVEAVSAAGIGYERKEIVASEVVDPRKRSPRGCDDVLAVGVIKISVFHIVRSPLLIF